MRTTPATVCASEADCRKPTTWDLTAAGVSPQIVAEQMEGLPQELLGEQNDAMESAA